MRNFKRDNDRGRRRNDRGFNNRNSRPAMHKAVCSKCGKDCEVPFKPTGEKPIFCDDCFREKRNSEPKRFDRRDSRRSPRRDFRRDSRKSNNDRTMHKAICDKCGKACEVPFKPTSGKPIYCSECFEKEGKNKGSDHSKEQFEMMNDKLDKILEALSPSVPTKKSEKKKAVKKETTKKSKSSKAKPKAKSNSKSKKPIKSKTKKGTTKKKK
jgi:CxxC-x17-CxxC domain-containing protein